MRFLAARSIAPWLALVAVVPCGAGLCATACRSPAAPASGASLLVITLDTTRADRLEPYGAADVETPALAALARAGVVFERAYAVAPVTLPAHASIFTGLYPPELGVRLNGAHHLAEGIPTLAERLAAAGRRTAAFVASAVLDRSYGLARGFEVYDDSLTGARERRPGILADRPAGPVVDGALSWLDGLAPEEPFFLWVHLFDPHADYLPPSPYAERYRERPYDGEIAYMDSQIGRLLAHPRLAVEEEVLVLALGDHGESLGEHGERTHGILAYDATLRVPWILRLPGGRGAHPELAARVERPVSQVDVVPTVLDLLGLPDGAVPSGEALSGESLVPLLREPEQGEERTLYGETLVTFYNYGWAPLHAVWRGRWKYIDAPGAELYDLSRDPGERDNLLAGGSGTHGELVRELRGAARRLAARAAVAPPSGARAPDRREAEVLRSLGYAAAPSGRVRVDGERLDPKQVIDLHEALESAGRRMDKGRYDEAAAVVEEVLRRDPTNLKAWLDLAAAREGAGRGASAVEAARRALELDPEHAFTLLTLSRLEALRGRGEVALELVDRALDLDPRDPEAWIEKARQLRRLGRDREAAATLATALERFPESPALLLAHAELVDLPRGDTGAAAERLAAAVERDPFVAGAWRLHARLGVLLLEKGEGEEGEAHLRRAIATTPRPRAELHITLGDWLAASGRAAEAREEYARALAAPATSAADLVQRAAAHHRLGRPAEAAAELRRAAALAPESAEVHDSLAGLAVERRAWGEAEEHARRATELDPDLPSAWNNLAIALEERGRRAEAAEAYRRALELAPGFWQARFNQALLLRDLGRLEEAAAAFQEVLRRVPDHERSRRELAEVRRRLAAGDGAP